MVVPVGLAVTELASKSWPAQPAVLSSQVWQHAFGQMLIQTCVDGSVWVDGKPVPDTLAQPLPLSCGDAAQASPAGTSSGLDPNQGELHAQA